MGAIIVDVKQQPNPRGRLYFVDWLRVVLTINVVVMHSMLTYTSDGQMEAAGAEPVLNAMFWFFTLGGWAFRMMLFFVLAGYFTRGSYHSKGPARFLWDRTLRLLLPAVLYACLVQPFLYWISNSSDAARATAYVAEVEEFGEFYTDSEGNMDVPPPHTRTLGEWYKAYFTEPGLFGFDGPNWFVYNL
ncbi:hypothetical protein OEZ86_002322 [Tetradesmus obliquus]|nr:hypothetical protein OEZ86_002322 [Tetradesmus obliquus]